MKLRSTCKCGAEFEVEYGNANEIWARERYREWNEVHKGCIGNPYPPLPPIVAPTPYAPWTMPYQPWTTPNHPPMANNCPKCGLKLEGVMGYCCPNAGCPTGLGPVTCKAPE